MTNQTPQRVVAEDCVPLWQKFIYGLAGPVDILSVWLLVSIAYQMFQMELHMSFNQVAVILILGPLPGTVYIDDAGVILR